MKKFAFIFLLLPAGIKAQTFKGTVTHITDGDTFTLLIDNTDSTVTVNLYRVDCPELTQDNGTIAKRFVYDLIFQRHITVVQEDKDPKGTVYGMVYVGTHNVNEAVLRAGMGWHYNYNYQNPEWDKLQDMARKGKTGLWKDSNLPPVPPWEFVPAKKYIIPARDIN